MNRCGPREEEATGSPRGTRIAVGRVASGHLARLLDEDATVPVYVQPAPVWGPPARVYAPQGYRTVSQWDHDGDGIPNRHDRPYNPRWDRDGDGVPNRRDRNDNAQRGDARGSWAHRPDRQDGPGRRGD